MAAATATFRAHRGQAAGWRFSPREFALAGLTLLLFIALFLLVRRLAGGFTVPAGPWLPWLAVVGLVALAAAIRWLEGVGNVRASRPSDGRATVHWRDIIVRASITAALLLAGCALSWPVALANGTVSLWLLLIVAEGLAWWKRPQSGRSSLKIARLPTAEESLLDDHQAEDPAVRQQLVRRKLEDDGESVTGWITCDFAPGQRTAAAHVAFCPPLAAAPRIEVRQLSGPSCRLRVMQSLAYGGKIEARLEAAAREATTVRIGLTTMATVSTNPRPTAPISSR